MKFFQTHILATLVSLCAVGAVAAEPVSLEALVEQALTDNPELRFYEAEIGAARGERRTAGAWANPESSSEVARKRLRGDAVAEGTAWAASVTQTFEWPGRVSLRKAIANRQIDLAHAGLEQFRSALAAQVRQKGFALYGAQRREAAAQEVAARGEELVATLVQREPAGVTPLLETRAIEATVIKLRRDALEASREAKAALFELNALRGRPISQPLEITGVVVDLPDIAPVEELLRRAWQGNFELRQREIELAQQGFRLRLAENEAWPSISLGPQFSQEKAGSEKESIAGLSVGVPLPLWNRNQGGIETANARLTQAEASLNVTLRDLERKIRDNAAAYEQLRKELARLNPKTADQLREAAILADRHFRLGAVPLATYLEVQQSYLEALSAIFSTQGDALNARAELDLLTGASIPSRLRSQAETRSTTTTTRTTTKSRK